MLTLLVRFCENFEKFLSDCHWLPFMADHLLVLNEVPSQLE